MGCLPWVAMVVWLIEWTNHHTPYLLHTWNPWNISLIVIVALMVLGSGNAQGNAKRLNEHW